MEKLVDLLLNAENVRMMVVLALGYCGYVRLNMSFEKRFNSLDRKIDDRTNSLEASILSLKINDLKKIDDRTSSLEASIMSLKTNDFAHLSNTIKALTFMLEKNKFLEKEDKEYIDGMMGR